MNVEQIVKDYLIKNKLDGLCNSAGACACLVDDLAPCGSMQKYCLAGNKTICDESCSEEHGGWHIEVVDE